MKYLPVMLAAATLSGCAVSVPTTGVVNRGNDVYTVAHQGATGFHSVGPLKISATQEASEYCARQNKKFVVLHTKEIAGRAGQYTEAEIVFKCE